jgi:hypothetical protein
LGANTAAAANHDSCLKSEFSHEAPGIGGDLGEAPSENDPFLADQTPVTCAHARPEPYRLTRGGAYVERRTHCRAKEDGEPMRFEMAPTAEQSGACIEPTRARGTARIRTCPNHGE